MNVETLGAELGRAILAVANQISRSVGYTYIGVTGEHAPQTLPQLRQEAADCFRSGKPFRVSFEHCDDTLYGNALANMAFRFWHDHLHVVHDLNTSLQDELKAGRLHVEAIKSLGYSTDHQNLMWIDTCGQSLYNFLVGEFPRNQLMFTEKVVKLYHAGNDLEWAVKYVANHFHHVLGDKS